MLPTPTAPPARRGQALLVTLSSLALLALVGITAVYFTRDQAEQARIRGMTNTIATGGDQGLPDDGIAAVNSFLSGMIYDVPDEGAGLANPLRGHSLMATMYGRARPGQPTDPYPTLAWSGAGTFGAATTSPAFGGLDRRQIVNHRWFPGMAQVIDPEYTGERVVTAVGVPVGYTGTYYPKNPAYTYPDVKDYFLASLCPATGEVLVPSFHRDSLFGSLAPNNPNWTSARPQGKFQTLRPRPAEHPNFPPVPANGDGSYSGDVQNLPGGFLRLAGYGNTGNAVQRNDSIWIDIGLPPVTTPNGRRLKPLVAPLILDLDGRLNLSVHGNVMGNPLGTGPNPAHQSGAGVGPWEVSLAQVLGVEGDSIVRARGGARTQANRTSKAFYERYATATELPQYAQAPWIGFTAPNALQLPGFGGRFYATAPLYSNGYDATNDPTNFLNHPALFNPHEWPTAANNPRSFPLSDTKILSSRYAPYPNATGQLTFAPQAPNTLVGATVPAGAPGTNTQNNYRADPSHTNRHLFTTYSNSLGLGGLMPAAGQGRSPLAGLPPLDLNRQLADYRANPSLPLSDTNIGNAAAANADRQKFATDIFARLVAATNTPGATVTPEGTITIPSGTDDLRRLAQLAANIVDYIDNDDISTVFTWNKFGVRGTTDVYGVEKPRLLLNEVYSEVTNDPTDPVLTDPANPPAIQAGQNHPAQVRFWLELQNPTAPPYSAAGTGVHPLGDGSVTLKTASNFSPYQVKIVHETAAGNVTNYLRNNPSTPAAEANVTGDFNTPADIIFDFSPAAANQKVGPANANGAGHSDGIVVLAAEVPAAAPGSLPLPDFKPAAFAAAPVIQGIGTANAGAAGAALTYTVPLAQAVNNQNNFVLPKNHVVLLRRLANPYLPFDVTTNPYVTVDMITHVETHDRVLLGDGKKKNEARQPKTAAGDSGYDPTDAPAAGATDLRPQAYGKVQPYAAWSTVQPATFPTSMVLPQNPDGVNTASGPAADNARHTLGRANYRGPTAPAAPAGQTFNATAAPPRLNNLNATTDDTIWTPYEWLVHLDRPLVNQLELLQVSAGKPHELTTNFIRATGGPIPALVRHGHTISSLVTQPTVGTPLSQLYRALTLLQVQPFGHQTALGGRVSGKINVNTIQDRRVWRALFDAQSASGGSINTFDQLFIDNLYDRMIATRTTNMVARQDAVGTSHTCPIPGGTVHDGTGTDRPFLPFGAAEVASATGATFPSGTGLGDTLLRPDPASPGTPFLTVLTNPNTGNPVDHPYQQAEAARKILNNTTTVSHTFAVWVTVGYFDVERETLSGQPGVPDFVQIGREYYREVPGDSRHRFFAIVDRAHVGLDPASYRQHLLAPATTAPAHATTAPFHTTLEANAPIGTTTLEISASGGGANSAVVYTNGQPVTIAAATVPPAQPNPAQSTLVIGTGATRDIVTVTGVTYNAATGRATITIGAAMAHDHYAGENVSNVVPGNPGPQSSFDVNLDRYRAVVPFWTRIQ